VIKRRKDWGGQNYELITEDNRDVTIGELIDLKGEVTGADGAEIANHSWTIPPKRIKNYEADESRGKVTDLEGGDLDEAIVNFYWVDGGVGTSEDRVVQYSVSVDGDMCMAKETLRVWKPNSDVTAVTGSIMISSLWQGDNPRLSFGKPPDMSPRGISFTRSVFQEHDDFAGQTIWVQLIQDTLCRVRTESTGEWERLEASGVLDRYFPCFSSDSPNIKLRVIYDDESVNTDYEMWLMYKPITEDGAALEHSIWVPLRSTVWYWNAEAIRDDDEWDPDDLVPGHDHSEDPADTDSTEHPEWEHNINEFDFEPEE
jgi:hypothetical protein